MYLLATLDGMSYHCFLLDSDVIGLITIGRTSGSVPADQYLSNNYKQSLLYDLKYASDPSLTRLAN